MDMTFTTGDFDYPLDPELIAQAPLEQRDQSRLMGLDRRGGKISHHHFYELPDLLRRDDLLVVNDTLVVPAKFLCRRSSGGKVEGLFLRELSPNLWEVMLRNAGRCRPAERLGFDREEASGLELLENLGEGRWRVRAFPAERTTFELLDKVGTTPLPPYIHREAGQDQPGDKQRYQTLYARQPGAVAAPTAGLHFTDAVMKRLREKGVSLARVTLHVGLGTFLPVKADNLDEHPMHSEWFELSVEVADQINQARRDRRRIVAVGTTAVRVLESAARKTAANTLAATSGQTNLFLYPPSDFRVVDSLITNFHLPKSTLLMLVAAFCEPGGTGGLDMILNAYAEARAHRYRFYSYGDAMFIE